MSRQRRHLAYDGVPWNLSIAFIGEVNEVEIAIHHDDGAIFLISQETKREALSTHCFDHHERTYSEAAIPMFKRGPKPKHRVDCSVFRQFLQQKQP